MCSDTSTVLSRSQMRLQMADNNQLIPRAVGFNITNGSYAGLANMTNYHKMDKMSLVRNQ